MRIKKNNGENKGIDFHRIENEESEEIVDRYTIEDEDENVVFIMRLW